MSDNTPLLTVAVLLEELKEVNNWYMLGAYLNVPVYQLNKIQSTHTQDGVERCKLEMLQYWLDTTMTASWNDIARALEKLNMLTLAARLKLKYLRTSPATTPDDSSVQPSSPETVDSDASSDSSVDSSTAALVADVEVVGGLQDLESDFSSMMTDTRKDLADCDIGEVQFYLDGLFDVDEFRKCQNIDEVLHKLRRDHIDTFNIRYLERLVSRFHQSDAIVKTIEKYEEKKEEFLGATTVKEFQQAVVSRAETVTPRRMATVTIRIPEEYGIPHTMKDVEKLAKKAFKGCHKDFVRINVKPGSIIITWYVTEGLCEELVRLAQENIAVLREEGVEEVSIVGEKSVIISTQDGHEVNIPEITEQECAALKKVYGEFYPQLVDVLSDGDTHRSIVNDLHKRSVISEELAAQMTSTQERGRSLLTVLGLEEKPHKLRELITVMMEEEKVKSLAEEMTAQLSKLKQDTEQQQQFEARIGQLTSDKKDLLTRLRYYEEELKAANELLIMREKVISSMMAVKKRPELDYVKKEYRTT